MNLLNSDSSSEIIEPKGCWKTSFNCWQKKEKREQEGRLQECCKTAGTLQDCIRKVGRVIKESKEELTSNLETKKQRKSSHKGAYKDSIKDIRADTKECAKKRSSYRN